MIGLESSRHLYQTPRYTVGDGVWHDRFLDAVKGVRCGVTWDPAALLAMASFGFTCDDQTLFHEVRRLPWLSRIDECGQAVLEPIPPHGRKGMSGRQAAEELYRLLKEETREVCAGRGEVYILLSGGLDSRIVAAVTADLTREGSMKKLPVGVTWGMADSRDVAYGREVAKILGMEWVHLPIEPRHLLENVETVATRMGAAISPIHLHRLPWFSNLPREALVLSGSYGDSVGRGEFSGRTVLELEPIRPTGGLGIFAPGVLRRAAVRLDEALLAYRKRSGDQPAYVLNEHEQQSQYLRGMIGFQMTIVSDHCDVYRSFTHPSVYSFMWSIHPSLRTDQIYEELLRRADARLAALPWARTNRSMGGPTHGAQGQLLRRYHDYDGWIAGELWTPLREIVEPDWFAATGLFDAAAIERLGDAIRARSAWLKLYGMQAYGVWTWLAAVRRMAEFLRESGVTFNAVTIESGPHDEAKGDAPDEGHGTLRRWLRQSRFVRNTVRSVRKKLLRRRALAKYPVE
jgi:hypothetical protein